MGMRRKGKKSSHIAEWWYAVISLSYAAALNISFQINLPP